MKHRNARRVIVLEGVKLDALSRISPPYAVEAPIPWADAHDVARAAPPSAAVLVDPYAGARSGDAFPRLHDLLRRFPSLTVLAVMRLRPETVGDVTTLLEWGVSEVIDAGPEGTPRAVHARLRQAHARPLKRKLERALAAMRGDARDVLLGAAEVAVEGGGATELAQALKVAPRTLTERCTRAELPAPRQVQAWMRILLACMLLDDPGRTVYAAAFACGYSTDRSLRRAVSALMGLDATALRRGGAFTQAARAFDEVVRRVRDEARERGRVLRAAANDE